MDPSYTLRRLIGIVRDAPAPRDGWIALLDLAQEEGARRAAALLREVPVEPDVDALASQLAYVLDAQPPPIEVDTLYFGLFDAIDLETREAVVGLHVAGLLRAAGDDPDARCEPRWSPAERMLHARLLDAVRALSLADPDNAPFYEHALMLGAAGVLARFAAAAVAPEYRVLVGFDHGDCFEAAEPPAR